MSQLHLERFKLNYDVNVYTRASSTLNASSVGTLINTAGKLFHVRIAEGKYEFWWLCITWWKQFTFWLADADIFICIRPRHWVGYFSSLKQ